MIRIGIDLGGTNIVAGVVNEEYRILATAKCKTALPRPAEEIVADMARVAREAVEKAGFTMDDVAAVGVGSPGTCRSTDGVVERSNNLGFSYLPMGDMLKAHLQKPVHIENDANAAAYGEFLAGAAKGHSSCVCITLGTGVGGGVIVDGRIMSGFNFAGAELGHTVIVADGAPCTCGRRGCFEAYASATALIRQTKEAMERHPDSRMWQLSDNGADVSGRTAFDGMQAGDAAAKEVVDNYIRYLACGITNMVNIFQPEVLCVGGGVCNQGENLLGPVRAIVAAEQYNRTGKKQTEIVTAQLGNDAGIIGAAFLGQ